MSDLVMPGEVLATEEEMAPSSGTFVEGGKIRSAVAGTPMREDSNVAVKCYGTEVGLFKRGMATTGLVTDDLRSVVFVRMNEMREDGSVYVALKSGKVVNPRPMSRFQGRGDRRGGRDSHERPQKPLKVGDFIAARIIAEDNDVYTLSINMPEFGVVYAECEFCSTPLEYDSSSDALKCGACGHTEHKKVSTLYGDAKGVEELLKKYASP